MVQESKVQIIRCSSCGSMNRVPLERLRGSAAPVCGKCKTRLEVVSGPTIVTDQNFATEVEGSSIPVLLDLWAAWCGPCRMIAPFVEQLASELAGRIKVAKLNIDENKAIPSRFHVQSIPTLLVLQNGREVERIVGAVPKQEILRKLEPFL